MARACGHGAPPHCRRHCPLPTPLPSPPPLGPRPPMRRRNLASAFRSHVVNSRETDAASLAPVRQFGDASYIYLRASNVYLLAITKRNSNAMMVMQFLSRVGAAATSVVVWLVLLAFPSAGAGVLASVGCTSLLQLRLRRCRGMTRGKHGEQFTLLPCRWVHRCCLASHRRAPTHHLRIVPPPCGITPCTLPCLPAAG